MSQTENKILMTQARESLSGNWGLVIGTFLVFMILFIFTSEFISSIPFIGWLISFIISGALELGWVIFILSIARNQKAELKQIFKGFDKFGKAFGVYFFRAFFIFAWMLLFIIPGIIAAYSYAMAFYLIVDNPSMNSLDAITKSKELMNGNRWKLFCLQFRFIGWLILSVLTFGITLLWIVPYMSVSIAKFYENIKDDAVLLKGKEYKIEQQIISTDTLIK